MGTFPFLDDMCPKLLFCLGSFWTLAYQISFCVAKFYLLTLEFFEVVSLLKYFAFFLPFAAGSTSETSVLAIMLSR